MLSGSAEHSVAVLNTWFCEETCGSRQTERTSWPYIWKELLCVCGFLHWMSSTPRLEIHHSQQAFQGKKHCKRKHGNTPRTKGTTASPVLDLAMQRICDGKLSVETGWNRLKWFEILELAKKNMAPLGSRTRRSDRFWGYIPRPSFVAQFVGTWNFKYVSTNLRTILKFQDSCTENVRIHAPNTIRSTVFCTFVYLFLDLYQLQIQIAHKFQVRLKVQVLFWCNIM